MRLAGAGVAIACLYMYASLINDIYDVPVDLISNPRRPIAASLMTRSEATRAAWFFAVLTFALAFAVGTGTRYLVPLGLLLAWSYSSPPLRLRRFICSSLVVGIGSLLAFLIGYTALDFSPAWTLPLSIKLVAVVILVVFSIGQMVRDLKDYLGDKAAGIKTVFTVYGRERGKKIMTGLLALCFLAPLVILHSGLDVLVFLMTGAAAVYLFILREAADRVILLSSFVSLYTVVRLVG